MTIFVNNLCYNDKNGKGFIMGFLDFIFDGDNSDDAILDDLTAMDILDEE